MLRSHTDPPRDSAFSDDGKLLATAHTGGEVIIWDVASGTPRERLKTSEVSWAVAFGPDARTLYTAGDKGVLRVYDLGGQQRYLRSTQAVHPRQYLHVLASDNGQKTAYMWREGDASWVSIADVSTGRMTTPTRLGLELEEGPQTPAAWHPNGQRLAIHDLNTITIIDTRTGKLVKEQGVTDVLSVAYVDNGNRIVSGTHQGTRYFDAKLTFIGLTPSWVADCCTAPSPDGETAALFEEGGGGATMNWRIVRAATGEVVSEGNLSTVVDSAAYSPDGRLIAGTGASGRVFTIDTRSRVIKYTATTGHSDEGQAIRFSPDGTRIVSGAADGTVSLWDANTLDLLGTVSTSTEGKPVAVSPTFTEGSDVVTIAAYDGKTYRWDTRVNQTIAYACAMAGRNLTLDEWTQAFGNRAYEKTCL